MNKTKLAQILRERAEKRRNHTLPRETDFDDAELFDVLARVLEGKDIDRAFGAPGDWGYGTPIGDALAGRP